MAEKNHARRKQDEIDVAYGPCFPSNQTLQHFLGWLTLMTAYGIIWGYYGVANHMATGGSGAPDFVHVITIAMFILFNSFGVIQMCQLYGKGRCGVLYNCIGIDAEFSYVTMSIVAKTVLGWVIYAQVIVMAGEC